MSDKPKYCRDCEARKTNGAMMDGNHYESCRITGRRWRAKEWPDRTCDVQRPYRDARKIRDENRRLKDLLRRVYDLLIDDDYMTITRDGSFDCVCCGGAFGEHKDWCFVNNLSGEIAKELGIERD